MIRKLFLLLISVTVAMNMSANKRIDTSEENWTYGNMLQWRAHTAFSTVDKVAVMGDRVYALSNKSLFSVDKITQEIEYHNRLTGLNASMINQIAYNSTENVLLVTYQNGQLDVIDARGEVYNIPDLYLKQMNASKAVNDIYMYGTQAYLSMSFGIMVVDMKRREVRDTYYLGQESSEVNVQSITITGDSIYAISKSMLYSASLADNLMDYAFWKSSSLPDGVTAKDLCMYDGHLHFVRDDKIWRRSALGWQVCSKPFSVSGIRALGDALWIIPMYSPGTTTIDNNTLQWNELGMVYDIAEDLGSNSYWLCTSKMGLYYTHDDQSYTPHGPIDNSAYRMHFFGDRLYVVPGGRWATQNMKQGHIMYLENDQWTNISSDSLYASLGLRPKDLMNVAQDPMDENHYFVTSYGYGVLEMYGTEVKNHFTPSNSPLWSAAPNNPKEYTRTDGAIYDDQGNVWVLNAGGGEGNVHIISPDGKWHTFDLVANRERIILHTPGEILVDSRNPQWKWIPLCRYNPGLLLLKDNGTPTNPNDDKVIFHSSWYDQNNNYIKPSEIHSLAQDRDGVLWVGTNEGLFLIPATVDFATSNACERVIIPRNDGTKLADYLLDNEKITCIVVDGANRKWIGTANSGVFLVSEDGLETISHFTAENSPLLSNAILSIAIHESTGEVFIGTSDGLMSYMSDAVVPQETFANIYAYPNPVHPNYHGYVVIKGLMEDSEVRIVDASGNLVKLLPGMGGEAVWDMTNAVGDRVASGVYTAICNTKSGKGHGTVKILIIN